MKETAVEFKKVDHLTEASSLAYTTIFAIPGVLIITLMVASTFYDAEAVQEALYSQAGGLGFIPSKARRYFFSGRSEGTVAQRGLRSGPLGEVARMLRLLSAQAKNKWIVWISIAKGYHLHVGRSANSRTAVSRSAVIAQRCSIRINVAELSLRWSSKTCTVSSSDLLESCARN